MKYEAFKELVKSKGWTIQQLRCDVPPNDELLALIDSMELTWYERYLQWYEKEQQAS